MSQQAKTEVIGDVVVDHGWYLIEVSTKRVSPHMRHGDGGINDFVVNDDITAERCASLMSG